MSAFETARNQAVSDSKSMTWNFEACSKGAKLKLSTLFCTKHSRKIA
jgi:hypothetical protein